MPKGYSRNNPLDILGDALAERYEKVLKFLTRFSLFDFFVVILSPQAMTQSLETVQALAKIAKPIFIVLEAGQSFDAARKFLKTQRKIIFNDVFDLRILGKILNF